MIGIYEFYNQVQETNPYLSLSLSSGCGLDVEVHWRILGDSWFFLIFLLFFSGYFLGLGWPLKLKEYKPS